MKEEGELKASSMPVEPEKVLTAPLGGVDENPEKKQSAVEKAHASLNAATSALEGELETLVLTLQPVLTPAKEKVEEVTDSESNLTSKPQDVSLLTGSMIDINERIQRATRLIYKLNERCEL